MIREVKCKQCDCMISVDYEKIDGNKKMYLSNLKQSSTKTCDTPIFLTCENNHTDKYFCKIVYGYL